MQYEENVVYVFDKNENLIAVFDKDHQALSPEAGRNIMISPTTRVEQNGVSTLTFQMVADSEKFQQIKNPENIFRVNNRRYTLLGDDSIHYSGESSTRIANVTACELWYLLDRKYVQIYNCGLYCYARAVFQGYSGDGLRFSISASGCSNPGNTISSELAWHQVRLWQPKDNNNNQLIYTVLKDKEHAPTGWEDAPVSVAMSSFSVSGNTATMVVKATAVVETKKVFTYDANKTYQIEEKPYPTSLKSVQITTTTTTDTVTPTSGGGTKTHRKIVTSTKSVNYSYSSNTGTFSIRYTPSSNEEISSVIATYDYSNLGNISPGASAYFAYGAEAIDEHTVLILPKADKKYKLTINGVEYDDSQVRDSRGTILQRGSAGYATWALLKATSWNLGIADVMPKDFNVEADCGSFNVESDMKDVLYNLEVVRDLFGGIFDFNSVNKVLNYRAENSEDYNSFNDGFNDWTGYEFREGKNMIDQPEVQIDNTLITKGYVLGYNNLNIKKVNGGKSYVTDFSYTTNVYEGYLEQPLIYDTRDEGGMKQLLYWGQKEIKKKSRPRETITAHVTDIRTAQGYEHEIFDINNVVKIYMRDTETGKEVPHLKRIITWEKNIFAPWDCTVELGEKTRNLTEIFNLIYNKAVEEAPKTNASGQIAVDDIVMEFDWEEIGLPDIPGIPDIGTGGGGGGYGGGGYGGYGNTISNYISLIARQVTENSEAIAGLILEATDLYAQAELFASYRKQLDDMIAETYAGLKLYADELGSSLEAKVEGNYQMIGNRINDVVQNVDKLGYEISRVDVQSSARFQAIETAQYSQAQQLSQYGQQIYDMSGTLRQTVQSVAQCVTYADANKAYAALTADYEKKIIDSEGKVTKIASEAGFKAEANAKAAFTEQFSSYQKTIDGKIASLPSKAWVQTYASENYAKAELAATVGNIGANFVANANSGAGYSIMRAARTGGSGASISVNINGNISMMGGGTLYCYMPANFSSSVTIKGLFNGYSASWIQITQGLWVWAHR